jgi:hypothetical protein
MLDLSVCCVFITEESGRQIDFREESRSLPRALWRLLSTIAQGGTITNVGTGTISFENRFFHHVDKYVFSTDEATMRKMNTALTSVVSGGDPAIAMAHLLCPDSASSSIAWRLRDQPWDLIPAIELAYETKTSLAEVVDQALSC